ncbi:MAG: hypothetical protein R6X02_34735 [Enhygromyxa sp.]
MKAASRRTSSSRALAAVLTASATALCGCAGLTAPREVAHVDLDSPAMRDFPVAAMTDMERDVRLETGTRRNQPLTPALFWTGIGVGTLGAVGGITFGVMGFVAKNQLNDAYYDGGGTGLTVAERDRLVNNGELYNGLAIGMTALSVLGYALAIVSYGVDWNRCGPLVEKKRRCKELGLGDYAKRLRLR